MTKVGIDMTMSLDGFVAGPGDGKIHSQQCDRMPSQFPTPPRKAPSDNAAKLTAPCFGFVNAR